MGMRAFVFGALAAATVSGCAGRPIDVKNANEVIRLCQTNVRQIRAEFGEPSNIGMLGGMVTNEWTSFSGNKMIVAFVNDIAVDIAVYDKGIVELKNRCR
jgi:hypothetical protein